MGTKKKSGPDRKHPVFDIIDSNPKLLSDHAKYMAAGGERLLHAMTDCFRQDVWPWGMEAHAQASFGAFCAGVAWASRFLRNLPEISNNRKEAIALMAAVGPAGLDETTKEILRTTYNLSDEEIKAAENKGGTE